jgi:hypothetical protein
MQTMLLAAEEAVSAVVRNAMDELEPYDGDARSGMEDDEETAESFLGFLHAVADGLELGEEVRTRRLDRPRPAPAASPYRLFPLGVHT